MLRYRPHSITPCTETIRLVIFYKNFAANKNISHIGLGVSALNTMQTLRKKGVLVEVYPAVTPEDIDKQINYLQMSSFQKHQVPISHVLISAPWVPTDKLQKLLMTYNDIHFAVISHSNVGFLQADPNGIKLLREALELQVSNHNFNLAANSKKFCEWATTAWGQQVTWLPNLYNISTMKNVGLRVPWHPGSLLKMGIFGANRPLKNSLTAVAAACEVAAVTKAQTEIWLSSGRDEGGAQTITNAIKQMTDNIPNVQLRYTGWQPWPGFRKIVGSMNLVLQPSYTESFCVVAADAIAEGVACVTSEAIDWAPEIYKADSDDATDISKISLSLLHNVRAVNDGQEALKNYVHNGINSWEKYLLHK